jgi:hypothetical protein
MSSITICGKLRVSSFKSLSNTWSYGTEGGGNLWPRDLGAGGIGYKLQFGYSTVLFRISNYRGRDWRSPNFDPKILKD